MLQRLRWQIYKDQILSYISSTLILIYSTHSYIPCSRYINTTVTNISIVSHFFIMFEAKFKWLLCIIYLFIYSFNRLLLSTYFRSGTVVDIRDRAVHKQTKFFVSLPSCSLHSSKGKGEIWEKNRKCEGTGLMDIWGKSSP